MAATPQQAGRQGQVPCHPARGQNCHPMPPPQPSEPPQPLPSGAGEVAGVKETLNGRTDEGVQ